MSDNQRAVEVLVYGRSGFIGSFVFPESKVTIGRDSKSMVHLDDPLVSRNHALLTLEGGLFRIKDMGSRTGIKINGTPVRPRQPIEPSDDITIGPFRIRVTLCEPESASGPASEEPTRTLAIDSRPPSSQMPTTMGARPATKEQRIAVPTPFYAAAAEDTAATLVASLREARSAVAQNEPNVRSPKAESPAAWSQKPEPSARSREVEPPSWKPPPIEPAPHAPAPTSRARPESGFPPPHSNASLGTAMKTQAMIGAPVSRAPAPVPQTRVSPVVESLRTDTADLPPLAFGSSEAPSRHDDDDDEDDDSDFVPPFDLVDALIRGGQDEKAAVGRKQALEVIHYRDDRIISVRHPRSKGAIQPLGSTEPVGMVDSDGGFVFYPEAVRSFSMQERGRALTSAEALAMRQGNSVRVVTGMQVGMDLAGDDKMFVRWVSQTEAVRAPRVFQRPSKDGMTSGAVSLAVHLGIMAFVGLVLLGEKKGESDINAGRFATVDLKELELEPPPPKPPDPPKAPDAPPMVDNSPRPLEHVKSTPTPVNTKSSSPEPGPPQPTAASQKILSALGATSSSVSAISVTNLDALPVGAGDFKVSGAVGKAPGDTLRVASPGSGSVDVNTKSATELGAGLAKVQAHTGGVVRARVTTAVSAVRGEGHLDRSEIQKVVNAHLFQVQGCYERQLAKDPSISGKISYEWVVDPSGGVSSVRIGRSTIHSVEVTTCIQSAIAGWKFPQPQGGSVTVTYPFAFSSLGG